MSRQKVLQLPTVRLYEGDDDDLIEWLDSLDDEHEEPIKEMLRHGIDATAAPSAIPGSELSRGRAWVAELLRRHYPDMPEAGITALAGSSPFRDVVAALDAIDRFFEESRSSWNEIVLSTLWSACRQLLHRILERRRQLAPQDRRRMQELEALNLPFMQPPNLAGELADRAEALYDRKLSNEERRQLTATIRAFFEEE